MHTPGPWFALRCEHGWHIGPQPDGVFSVSDPSPIGSIHDNSDGSKIAEQEANARLIAAAPNLLAALKQLEQEVYSPEIMGPIHPTGSKKDRLRQALDHARLAIAEAEPIKATA